MSPWSACLDSCFVSMSASMALEGRYFKVRFPCSILPNVGCFLTARCLVHWAEALLTEAYISAAVYQWRIVSPSVYNPTSVRYVLMKKTVIVASNISTNFVSAHEAQTAFCILDVQSRCSLPNIRNGSGMELYYKLSLDTKLETKKGVNVVLPPHGISKLGQMLW